jgi:hypothetical protein
MDVRAFDSTRHVQLDTMESGFIVQFLGDNAEIRISSALQNRQDGLCRFKSLASVKTYRNYKKRY